MATGIEASGAPKQYQFGDTMNIDAGGTILNAVLRSRGRRHPGRPPSAVPQGLPAAALSARAAQRIRGVPSPSTSTTKT